MKFWPAFLTLLLATSGCSSIRRMAIGTTTPVLLEATDELQREADWNALAEGMPGNIMMMEGLLGVKPKDSDLLVAAIKAHAGAGFGVYETLYLDDKYAEKSNSVNKQRTLVSYSKSIAHGLTYLEDHGVTLDDLTKGIAQEGGVKKVLDSELSHNEKNHQAVFYIAQAWGGFINLQRENMSLISQLPIVKGMFDWVCDKDPEINYGACALFYGSYEAGRPRMLGGNPEKGFEIFKAALKKYPYNYVIQSSILEYYAIPLEDEDVFNEYAAQLENAQAKLNQLLVRAPGAKVPQEFQEEKMRLFQAIALKRYSLIKKYKKDIF